MCRVLAVSNQKGGVGKTTACVNLGIGLAREGKKVLLVEADAQGSMVVSLGISEPDELDVTLVNILEKVINDEEVEEGEGIIHHEEGIDFIPANIELAGLETSLVNAAILMMVDTNIQREDILPSEKAKAYKQKYDAMKHQGSKRNKFTADEVREAAGESGRTVQRYIRLAELVDGLLEYVDTKKISLVIGEMLSFLKVQEQEWLLGAISNSGVFPSKVQALKLKESSKAGVLSESNIYAVLVKKDNGKPGVTISAKKISSYFPEEYTKEQIEEVIYSLLDRWKQEEREGGTAYAEDTV